MCLTKNVVLWNLCAPGLNGCLFVALVMLDYNSIFLFCWLFCLFCWLISSTLCPFLSQDLLGWYDPVCWTQLPAHCAASSIDMAHQRINAIPKHTNTAPTLKNRFAHVVHFGVIRAIMKHWVLICKFNSFVSFVLKLPGVMINHCHNIVCMNVNIPKTLRLNDTNIQGRAKCGL